jgi:hypothetical protein
MPWPMSSSSEVVTLANADFRLLDLKGLVLVRLGHDEEMLLIGRARNSDDPAGAWFGVAHRRTM